MKEIITINQKNRPVEAKEQKDREWIIKHEEDLWLRTIYNAPLAEAKRFVTLSEGLKSKEFATEGNLRKAVLATRTNHDMDILNQIIDASPLANQGKPAQLLRLKNQGKEPLSLVDFLQTSQGEDIRYFRTVKGYSQKEFGEAMGGRKQSTVAHWENNTEKPGNGFDQAFLRWLEIPETSAIAKIMKEKGEGKRLIYTAETNKLLSESPYLFAEHLINIRAYPVAKEDKELLQKVREESWTSGAVIKTMRLQKELTKRELADKAKVSIETIRSFENRRRTPQPNIALRLAKGFGYTIHHPITHTLLKISDQERQQKRKPRQLPK